MVGCGKKEPKIVPENLITNPIVEREIRKRIKKPTGELPEADLKIDTSLPSVTTAFA